MGRYFTAKKVRKQMYPATYTFMDEADLASGTDIDFIYSVAGLVAPSTVSIIASQDGHRKVLQLYDANAATYGVCYHGMSGSGGVIGNQTFGTIEFWVKVSDVTKESTILFADGASYNFGFRIDASILYVYEGAGWVDTTFNPVNDTWYHIRYDFDCTAGVYQGLAQYDFHIYIDGVHYGDYDFQNDNPNIDRVTILQSGVDSGYYMYIDAWGESWDTDYNIGDNVFWRHYKGSEADTFEGDDVGTQGTSITWVDGVDTAASVEIIQEYNEHKKILRQAYTSAAGGNDNSYHDFVSQSKTGWFAFWFKVSDVTTRHLIGLKEDADSIILFQITGSKFQIYDGSLPAYRDVTGAPVPVNDTWYLIYIRWYDSATDTFDLWIDNIQYEDGAQNMANQNLGINRVYLYEYTAAKYFYLDAPISSLDGDERGDNRLFDYNDSYTREDITTLVANVHTTNLLHVWRTGTLYANVVYYYDEVFFQIYDVNGKLGMEADLISRSQNGVLYTYPLLDKNADDMTNESSNTFSADDIHDPTDATSMLKVILPNVSEADGDLILVDADTKTDTYSPVTKNYPDYMMLRDISDIADSVVIIEANGKCYLDDDKASGDALDLDTAADKLKMTAPPVPTDIVGVNYFVIKGAMNMLTGIRFSKVVDNSGGDKKNTFRIRNDQLRSQADVDAYAAKLALKLIAVRQIVIQTQGLGVHTVGETFNYKYVDGLYSIAQKDYYIIREDYNYDDMTATITLSEGLVEKSKYAQKFERAEDLSDSYAAQIYELDLITVMLNLFPDSGAEDHYNGIDTIKGEIAVGNFYLGGDIDADKDIILDFVFMNGIHGARTTDGVLTVTKFDTDGSFTTVNLFAGSFDAVFSEDSGLFHIAKTIEAAGIEADHAYRVNWTNDETDNGNATTCYVASIQVKYYRKLGG